MSRIIATFALSLAACASVPPAPLHDPVSVASNAETLVEPDLAGACVRYRAGLTDRRTLLACGKWMFFYETFGTYGVPASLPKLLVTVFERELGAGFSRLGMIEDPSSRDHLPFGLARGKSVGLTRSIGFTCASCHLAKLPDGRFAIGAPNHAYEYGRQLLALSVFPFVATGGPKDHAPEAVAVIQPLLDHLKEDPRIWAKLGGALMRAMGAFKIPKLRPETERMYASWPPGSLDFLIEPLSTNDDTEIVGKIPPLFDLPRPEEIRRVGMVHAMYGWSGNARTLESFLHGFIALGGGKAADWPAQKLRPLVEYLYSLKAPHNPSAPAAATVAEGKQLFRDKGCLACHDGPGHGGKRVYHFDEVGTDPALARWLDPAYVGQPCCGAQIEDPLTRGVKAPRLVALWAQRRFLHNGAVSSLEELFCLKPRSSTSSPLSTQGHRQTCDGLVDAEKHALIAYLRAL